MDITFTSSEIYKLLHPVKQYSILYSATLNKIKSMRDHTFVEDVLGYNA